MHFDTLEGWLGWQEGLHPLTIDLGLERAAEVFYALNPENIKPLTITVAGTNGKGSCVAYLEAIYRAQGYRVGTYTSPHILKYNERIKIAGKPVEDSVICAAFERIESVRGDISLSYFEFSTLAALDIFWRSDLDIQLLEVGLGGRLDAVNIIDPDVALISSIGIDHVYWLGNTRESIGKEKAGIFRPNKPAIVGEPNPPLTLIQTANDKNANLYLIGKDFGYNKQTSTWNWYSSDQQLDSLPEPNLKGEHQYRNASAVILAILKMAAYLPVSKESICSGLKNVQLSGRFQHIKAVNGTAPILLDVGHNPEAVTTLAEYLRKNFPNTRVLAIFSMMKDKDIAGVLNIMHPYIDRWFFAPLTNPRALTETAMRDIFLKSPVIDVEFGFNGFKEAFKAAENQANSNDLILVFGSFFLVSDCLNEFSSELTQ